LFTNLFEHQEPIDIQRYAELHFDLVEKALRP
jgi:hypothetical protein